MPDCVGSRQYDERERSELPRQLQILVGAEPVVVGVAAPYFIRVVDARRQRTDAVLPLVGRSKRAAWPADERGGQSAEGREEVGTQHPASAHVRAHQRHEINERGAASGGGDLDGRVAVGARAREREPHLLPRRSASLAADRSASTLPPPRSPQRQARGAPLPLHPDRSLIASAPSPGTFAIAGFQLLAIDPAAARSSSRSNASSATRSAPGRQIRSSTLSSRGPRSPCRESAPRTGHPRPSG